MFYRIVILVLIVATALTPAAADPKADAILHDVQAAARKVHTFQAHIDLTETAPGGGSQVLAGRMVIAKPIHVRQDLWTLGSSGKLPDQPMKAPHEVVIVSHRRLLTADETSGSTKPYSVSAYDDTFVCDFNGILPTANVFSSLFTKISYGGIATWNGARYRIISCVTKANKTGTPAGCATKLYVGADSLIHRFVLDGKGVKFDFGYTDIVLNARVPAKTFALKMPSFAKADTTAQASPSEPKVVAKVDPAARRILTAVAAKFQRTRCMTFGMVSWNRVYTLRKHRWSPIVRVEGVVALSKPCYVFNHHWYDESKSPNGREYEKYNYCDGKTQWRNWDQTNKYYERYPISGEGGPVLSLSHCQELIAFFGAKRGSGYLIGCETARTIQYEGATTWHGANYRVLRATSSDPYDGNILEGVSLIFIGKDNLPHRYYSRVKFIGTADSTSAIAGSTLEMVLELNDLQTPSSLPLKQFAFGPPAGWTEKQQYPRAAAQALIANGAAAPDFTVYDPSGKPVNLSDFAGKVVVIDFWSTWCGPCQMSLPGTNKIAAKYRGKNVVFLGVNTWDSKSAFTSWLPDHKHLDAIDFVIDTSPHGKDIAGTLYKVSGIPTQFVIGADGKVAWSNVGYGGSETPLDTAIAAALATPLPTAASPASQSPAGSSPGNPPPASSSSTSPPPASSPTAGAAPSTQPQ